MTDLTAELITETWRPFDVRLSPDGGRVAWTSGPFGREGEHPESAIWVADIGSAEPGRRWTRGGADSNPRWSPDGRTIAFLSDRAERGTSGLYLLRTAGGESEPLVVGKASVGSFCWSPDGSRIALCSSDDPDDEDKRRKDERDDADVYGDRWPFARLRLVDVATGEVETVVDGDVHVVDAAWSPGGATVAFTTQATPDLDEHTRRSLWLLDVASGDARRHLDSAYIEGICWTQDGSAVAYGTSHDPIPQSSFTVCAIGTEEGAGARCIGTQRDDTACSMEVRPLDGDRVAIVVFEGLDTRVEVASATTGARVPLWETDGDLTAFDAVPGAIVVAGGPRGALPEVWAGPPERLARLSRHFAAWADVELGAVEDLTCTASDGLALDAVVIRPPGTAATGPNATVVLVHGGPYGRSGRGVHCSPLDWGQWLATAGYTIVMPNYRGGLGHGEAFSSAARGDMGGKEWGDVMSIVDAAVERGIADPDRLGIGGWSQGGFLTAWAVTNTDRFKAAIMGAGVSDWGAMAAISDLPTFESALGGDTPWDGPGPHHAVERSPISYAARRTTPLLILHGQQDRRVPIGQATAFHRAMRGQDAPLELVTYPREPHGVGEHAHQRDILRRVRAWYDRFLRPEAD